MSKKNGSSKLAIKMILSFVVPLFLISGINGYAAEKQEFTELYEKAQKEGKVVFYASMQLRVAQELAKKFEEKYPGIKAEVYRNVSERLLSKVLAEAAAGKYFFDVVQMSVEKTGALKKAKLLAKYKPSSSGFYPEGFIDPDGYWTSAYHNPCTIAYNTKLIKPSEVPHTWEGLLDPKWKGNLAMDSTKYVHFIVLSKVMGEEKGVKYFKDLSGQKIIFRAGITNSAMLMAAGEFPIMAWAFAPSIERLVTAGAPVDWVRMKAPIPSDVTTAGIGERAPHPNAARLFYEFVLSKEGQVTLAASEKVSARTDIETPLQKEMKILDVRPNWALTEEEYSKATKLFRSTFGL